MFGTMFKVPWTNLNYFMDTVTGMKLANDFDGVDIRVYGPLK